MSGGIKRHRFVERGWSGLARGRTGPIEDGGQLSVRTEQRLDTLSHLHIRRTFPVKNGRLMDGICRVDRRYENRVNAFGINGHGIFLGTALVARLAA